MIKAIDKILNQNCLFTAERISVLNWHHIESVSKFTNLDKFVMQILTPKVTKNLPDSWQNLNTIKEVENWILERKKESNFYAVVLNETKRIIGFLFLYVENKTPKTFNFRIGYLLSDSVWGKGIGSELIKALVKWSRGTGLISSLSGGVTKENIGSIKVLEKNGFYNSNEVLPDNAILYQIDF